MASPATVAPTPIPAAAPVLRPELGLCVEDWLAVPVGDPLLLGDAGGVKGLCRVLLGVDVVAPTPCLLSAIRGAEAGEKESRSDASHATFSGRPKNMVWPWSKLCQHV
jgi:hypothetical protein